MQDVADSQSGHATEQHGLFEYGYLAGCGDKLLDFGEGKKLFLDLLPLNFFQKVIEIFADIFLLISDFQQIAECLPVSRCRIVGYGPFAVVTLTLGGEKIIAEPLAEIHRQVAESAFTLTIDSEVAQNAIPFLVFLTALLFEIVKEVHTQLLFVEKIELLVEELLEATATYRLRLFLHRGVELFFSLVFGRGIDIDAECFTTAHPVGVGITDGRIEIKVERDASTRDSLLAKENFGACIHVRCELKDLM